jgi:hypothetical protein
MTTTPELQELASGPDPADTLTTSHPADQIRLTGHHSPNQNAQQAHQNVAQPIEKIPLSNDCRTADKASEQLQPDRDS